MNARSAQVLQMPPARAAIPVVRLSRQPVRLTPIPWGKPDRATAQAVCQHIAEATPPLEIPANPVTDAKLRKLLRSHHYC